MIREGGKIGVYCMVVVVVRWFGGVFKQFMEE